MKLTILGTILVISFIFKITFDEARASSPKNLNCKLPDNVTLQVACTTDCGWFNTRAIKSAASDLGYNVKIQNIYSDSKFEVAGNFDAIIIPGGVDIDPKYYKDIIKDEDSSLFSLAKLTKEGKKRDTFEYGLLKHYFENDQQTPILGICRGMQMLSVAKGIPLYFDIKTQLGIKNPMYTIDTVNIKKPNSLIASLMKKEDFWGVQLHHQALKLDYFLENKDKWPELEVTAVSNKGKIAEVLEFRDRPIIGVQFHPEYTLGTVRNKLYQWLLIKACELKR